MIFKNIITYFKFYVDLSQREVWVRDQTSEMHNFRSFGDYEFRRNLKSRYRSLTNIVKITQERAFLINFL